MHSNADVNWGIEKCPLTIGSARTYVNNCCKQDSELTAGLLTTWQTAHVSCSLLSNYFIDWTCNNKLSFSGRIIWSGVSPQWLFSFQSSCWKRSSPGCWATSTSVVFHLHPTSLQRCYWAQPTAVRIMLTTTVKLTTCGCSWCLKWRLGIKCLIYYSIPLPSLNMVTCRFMFVSLLLLPATSQSKSSEVSKEVRWMPLCFSNFGVVCISVLCVLQCAVCILVLCI